MSLYINDSIEVANSSLEGLLKNQKENFLIERKCFKESGNYADSFAKCMYDREINLEKEKKLYFHKVVFNANEFFNCFELADNNKNKQSECQTALVEKQKILTQQFLKNSYS